MNKKIALIFTLIINNIVAMKEDNNNFLSKKERYDNLSKAVQSDKKNNANLSLSTIIERKKTLNSIINMSPISEKDTTFNSTINSNSQQYLQKLDVSQKAIIHKFLQLEKIIFILRKSKFHFSLGSKYSQEANDKNIESRCIQKLLCADKDIEANNQKIISLIGCVHLTQKMQEIIDKNTDIDIQTAHIEKVNNFLHNNAKNLDSFDFRNVLRSLVSESLEISKQSFPEEKITNEINVLINQQLKK